MNILSRILLATALSIQSLAPAAGICQERAKAVAICTHIQPMSDHPLAALPQKLQSSLRRAIHAQLQAIIHDSAMALGEIKPDEVPLNALQIARSANGNTLYVVAWNDRSFGANGFNWIVELTPNGASLLMSSRAAGLANGFGVEVLNSGDEGYPIVMIASKGYAQGGGPEGQAGCFRKKGHFYESTPCPETCRDNLKTPVIPE